VAVALPFVSAFLGVGALSLLIPPPATAQSGQVPDVRVSSFTLVGADGTILARLAPGGNGNGNLTLFDTAGTQRLVMAGAGAMAVFARDGTTQVYRAGRTFEVGPRGEPPVNGVLLSPDASISIFPSQ
jgi:hypothetical protein